MLSEIFKKMRVVDASVRSAYGDSPWRYFKVGYISFLRVNVYEVLCVATDGYAAPVEGVAVQAWDLDRLRAYREGKTLPREFYMDQAKNLLNPWVVLQDDEVVYIAWEVEKQRSRFLVLGDGEVEISHSLTLPAHRRKGLHRKAFVSLIEEMGKRGCERVFAVVHNENVNSLCSLKAIGMQTRARIVGPGRLIRKFNTARAAGDH